MKPSLMLNLRFESWLKHMICSCNLKCSFRHCGRSLIHKASSLIAQWTVDLHLVHEGIEVFMSSLQEQSSSTEVGSDPTTFEWLAIQDYCAVT